MSRHRQTYIELNPEPASPPTWALILGAILGAIALYCSIVFLFIL